MPKQTMASRFMGKAVFLPTTIQDVAHMDTAKYKGASFFYHPSGVVMPVTAPAVAMIKQTRNNSLQNYSHMQTGHRDL